MVHERGGGADKYGGEGTCRTSRCHADLLREGCVRPVPDKGLHGQAPDPNTDSLSRRLVSRDRLTLPA
ncbi:hypothetical protein ACFSKU_08695 [Pontibacter silvestris]|uniref:Uncharacterized protein n=1 Tax=Pontibacter silvestris TaxID=2305183 RepID=A0ABW4WX39_9BACT|nr:hypothetical protein [Pontibacter silvestris]MCC9138957.1 hypothetical protein [Pontibacter silvestris]